MTTLAVMQPYFVPYAGYFRLFAAADVFVAFDCVQFARRGWVHRNRFALATGEMDWLTLPILKCPRESRIDELVFAADATATLTRTLRRFPALRQAFDGGSPLLEGVLHTGAATVADYLVAQLQRLAAMLGLERPIVRSSTLGLDPELHGQARVIAIACALGATRYVNSPGGRALYTAGSFAERGIQLQFLSPYGGAQDSILSLLLSAPAAAIGAMIRRETLLAP